MFAGDGGGGGFVRGVRGRGRTRGGGRGGGATLQCFNCNQFGHKKFDCPQLGHSTAGTSQFSSGPHFRGAGDIGSRGRTEKAVLIDKEPISVEELKITTRASFVKRPDRGSKGRLIELIANHFRLVINNIQVYKYRIEIKQLSNFGNEASSGDTASGGSGSGGSGGGDASSAEHKTRKLKQKDMREVFDRFISAEFGDNTTLKHPVYDGDLIMITSSRLPRDTFDTVVEVDLETNRSKAQKYKISVMFTEQIDLSAINDYYDGAANDVPHRAIQAIELILKHGPTTNRVPIGNSLYPKSEQSSSGARDIIDRFGVKQVRFGHYQSMRLTKVGPTLLVDRSATAFYIGGSLVEFVGKLLEVRDIKDTRKVANSINIDRDYRWLTDQLKGLRIYTTHLPYKRTYVIKEVANKSPDSIFFEFEENGEKKRINVRQYFKEKYGKTINYSFPCIIPQGSKSNYLPLELCHVFADQPVSKGMLTSDNTASMVKRCGSQTPNERFQEVYQGVSNIGADSDHYLKEFQIDIDDRPLLVPGRVLSRPEIDGVNRRIYRSVALKYWVFVNLRPSHVRQEHVNSFLDVFLRSAANSMGVEVHKPIRVWDYDYYSKDKQQSSSSGDTSDIIVTFFKAAIDECRRKGGALQLILFVIPDDSSVYTRIKFNGDIFHGIATQCVKHRNVSHPPKGGVQQNLLLKINAKLGGINSRLKDLPDKPAILRDNVMIVGADVTHPAPADKLSSSVAACIGSYDKDHCCYSASIKVQERSTKAQSVEMIKEFDVIMKDLLTAYRQHNNGSLPKHIIYYRDGVSESQFDQVLRYEYDKLVKACRVIGLSPKVTFITVQKRHHTRFRPHKDNDGNRKNNILPGTTVDTHVIHPTDFDFYLCSHEGIQGTSRPTHYYVLHDDHNFSADELQKLTYYLCYTYARCEKPISIPSPVQYAHLAAYRARNHIVAANINAQRFVANETEEQRRQREIQLAMKLNEKVKVSEGLKNRLYYC